MSTRMSLSVIFSFEQTKKKKTQKPTLSIWHFFFKKKSVDQVFNLSSPNYVFYVFNYGFMSQNSVI